MTNVMGFRPCGDREVCQLGRTQGKPDNEFEDNLCRMEFIKRVESPGSSLIAGLVLNKKVAPRTYHARPWAIHTHPHILCKPPKSSGKRNWNLHFTDEDREAQRLEFAKVCSTNSPGSPKSQPDLLGSKALTCFL